MRNLVTAPLHAVRQLLIRQLSRILTKPLKNYTTRTPNDLAALKHHIRKGDIVLVEGEQRISEVIKYLTQSSWSHAALYVGDELMHRQHPQAGQLLSAFGKEADFLLIEALVDGGVVASPLSKYASFNIRVCRPHNLREEHLQAILDDAVGQLGYTYDLQNVLDLARYFLPVSLVPRRFRRKALHFGSGLPTQVICSSMLAAAFGKVGFPIVPTVVRDSASSNASVSLLRRLWPRTSQPNASPIFRRAHPTLTTPRDFDLSPYFEIVKFNVIESRRFDYSRIVWTEDQEESEAQATELSLPHP